MYLAVLAMHEREESRLLDDVEVFCNDVAEAELIVWYARERLFLLYRKSFNAVSEGSVERI